MNDQQRLICEDIYETCLVKTATHFERGFDNVKYQELQQSHPRLTGIVDAAFLEIELSFEQNKATYFQNAYTEILTQVSQIELLTKAQLLGIFCDEPLYLRNHMTNWQVILNSGTTTMTEFSLSKIHQRMDNSRYDPDVTPSLFVGWSDTSCRILFTAHGHVICVGGYCENELKYYLARFLIDLEQALLNIGGPNKPSFLLNVTCDGIKNKMVTSALPLQKLDLYSFNKFLYSIGMRYVYNPDEGQNTLILNPFPRNYPANTIQLFPPGGYTVYGFQSNREVNIIVHVVFSLIAKFIRRQEGFSDPAKFTHWRESRERERRRLEKNKQKKKQAKLELWKKLKVISSPSLPPLSGHSEQSISSLVPSSSPSMDVPLLTTSTQLESSSSPST